MGLGKIINEFIGNIFVDFVYIVESFLKKLFK